MKKENVWVSGVHMIFFTHNFKSMMVVYTLCPVFDLAHAQIAVLFQDGGKTPSKFARSNVW
jgi:hypothetical protein